MMPTAAIIARRNAERRYALARPCGEDVDTCECDACSEARAARADLERCDVLDEGWADDEGDRLREDA